MSEDYCRVEARKRLMNQGFSFEEADKIANDIYKVVKNGTENNSTHGSKCGCETDTSES